MNANEKYREKFKECHTVQEQEELREKWLKERLSEFPEKLNVKEVCEYLGLADSHKRFDWFQELVTENRLKTKRSFNRAFEYAYTTGIVRDWQFFYDWCYNNPRLDTLLCSDRPGKKELKALPDDGMITIYRGTGKDELTSDAGWYGPSWTTDRGVAEFFAFRHLRKDRVVVQTKVKKSDIKAMFGDRSEHEVLCMIYKKPKVVCETPTDEFDRFYRFSRPVLKKYVPTYNKQVEEYIQKVREFYR